MNALKVFWYWAVCPFKLENVFTPSTIADLTFVRRIEIEKKFHDQFKITGRQIIAYGHSGSGKTTFFAQYFKKNGIDPITIPCDSNLSFNQLILRAFDKLGLYWKSSQSFTDTEQNKVGGEVSYASMKGTSEYAVSHTESSNYTRIVDPQLSPQRLAEALGKAQKVLVIEDFHKLAEEEKRKLADMLKVFVDMSKDYPLLKVICIGAADTAREIVKLDNNLRHRVCEFEIPLLTDDEIKSIVQRGCDLLNVEMSQDLIERIVHYSNRLGALAHQLSYDICCSNDIRKTRFSKTSLTGEKFIGAVEAYIDARSDTLVDIYNRAIKDSLGWYVLRTFSDRPLSTLNLKQICNRVNTNDHPFSSNEIALKLAELSSADVNILRSSHNGYVFTVSDPFWGAFIKMKMAQEQADKARVQYDRANRNLQLQNQNDIESMLLHVLLNRYSLKK